MNYILGSGIIGLIAKHLLGDNWHVVPYYKSRFFTTNPPLDDNFLMRHERLDEIVRKLLPSKLVTTLLYKRAWSLSGILQTNSDGLQIRPWIDKTFGQDQPDHAYAYFFKNDIFQIYDDIRVSEIYKSLLDRHMLTLKSNASLGAPTKISNGYIYFGNERKPYDKIISTIPADILASLTGRASEFRANDVHFLHLHTTDLNFEGANQVMVVDNSIDFYKVVNIAPDRYLFYFLKDIPHPGIYMQTFLKNFEIIDGTMVKRALMLGNRQDSAIYNTESIYPIGGYAEWDHCLDVGSSILRLLTFLDNGK